MAEEFSAVFEHSGMVFESAKTILECSSALNKAVADGNAFFTVTD
ncbi:MAG: hypothetical protein AAB466_11315 [Verrucomicrobiota bacterium]